MLERYAPFFEKSSMLKALGIALIYLCAVTSALGQTANLILTEAQNNLWLDSLSNSALKAKLNLINQRLLNDTAVFVKKSYSDVLKGNYKKGSKVEGYGKPILIISGRYFIMENYSEPQEIIKLTKLLTLKNVTDISVIKATDPQATAIFGQVAENGVIILTISNKKIAKLFTNLKL